MKGLLAHPSISGFSLLFIALILGLILSLWAGWKLFAAFAGKNRRGALVATGIWYVVLFTYFSFMFFISPDIILLDFGVSEYELRRMGFAVGNYPLIFFAIFLVGGATWLFVLIKKKTVVSSSATPVSLTRAVWRGTRKALLLIVLVFFALAAVRIPAIDEKQRTDEVVQKIHATKLTLDDVLGKNLPPDPGAEADKTVAGVDANGNGIRDDVELAIFKEYPNSARIRAAEMQYAMGLQMELMQVFNSKTLVAAIQESGRGYGCIFDTAPPVTLKDSNEKWQERHRIATKRIDEVKNLVLNTETRKRKSDEIFDKYMTSFSSLENQDCDIELTLLPQ